MNNKKVSVALLATGMMLAGCVSTSKVTTQPEQLQHHRFVLESVNGNNVTSQKPLELSFGEKMHISGNMCNQFTGEGKLSDGELKVKNLAMTRMMCTDPQLNQLDSTLSAMLHDGVQVDLTENQLTLATSNDSLVYKLADLMN
ncbi:heat shock protein HslJ [Scandinavium sp. V105_16]|uniref:Heat shock protein HslJ n=1 Tax=Scandinavium lactucae TaxID=3095028 RepID=A0AAJ2SBN4_9ENTR|nr:MULTISPECIES: heat shock protein HslJ [unclassified Scandinavium]MDX6022405.1 heat shock protein HslJ [Scandinavium sp. V105_16]MDX6033753.1 heat shock protein HslJ [Scandinavium sp. V105_12]MDX6042399.1 heat shock protein HslJ [Scandinavium sp. V105_6]MDX6052400.1 heat shock protein HslJ [Scandinavium sp. V105_1]